METVITLVPLPDAALTDLKDALAQAALPHADVKEEGRQFFAGQCRGQSVGFIGFEVYGGEALLRSLVVREADRGQGFGSALVQGAIDAAAAQGATRVWVLTTTAVELLRRLGFLRVDRSAAPPAIRATTEFASLCPATAVCMTRTTA